MARVIRKIKKWFEYYGRNAAIVLVIVSVVGVGVWHASTSEVEVVQDDFGDASISEVAHEISNLSYEDGLSLLANDEMIKGRAVMQRLAPLNLSSKKATGNAKAHLWSAKDLIAAQGVGFLSEFPLAAAGGKRLAAPLKLPKNDVIARSKRHLEAAIALDPQLAEASILLAEVLVATEERNEAVASLHTSISATGNASLGFPLANALFYKGDDLGLEESSWHEFATLGREVSGSKRGELGVRVNYIVHALVLKQFELVGPAITKVERDFAGADAAGTVQSLKACLYYFQAVELLNAEEFDAKEAVALLLKAHEELPGQAELVGAMRAIVKKFPSLKADVVQGIGEVSQQMEAERPFAAADLHVFMAELMPHNALKHMAKAQSLNAGDPSIVAAWAEFSLEADEPNLEELERALSTLVKDGAATSERYTVLLTLGKVQVRGQKWMDALKSLEKALVLNGRVDKELHQLLGEAYRAVGQNLIADEHLALAAQ